MKRLNFPIAPGLLSALVAITGLDATQPRAAGAQTKPANESHGLQPNTLCAKDERVIFACALNRPAKIVSVCAAKNLTRETGYLQYRFGLPSRIELEFPKDRTATQEKFDYSHYFRAQVDLTEINFTLDGVNYSVVDDYNGEEKPPQTLQGVTINWPGTEKKEVRYACRTKPKTDYTDLQDVLRSGNPPNQLLAH